MESIEIAVEITVHFSIYNTVYLCQT